MAKPLHIGIVAGEASGDTLGAGLIKAIKQQHPKAYFEGIGGPRMIAEGFHSHVPMERLSVMGLIEVLGRLFELIGVRRRLARHFLNKRPDVFIGIDAPDFNLALERKLKKQGIKTVQYVSPQVWAWRQSRVKTIAESVDLILTLFPFEAEFYREHQVPVRFVGHHLADQIDFQTAKAPARIEFEVGENSPVLALLPGSRSGEVGRLADTFLGTAARCQQQLPGCEVLVAAANLRVAKLIESKLPAHPDLTGVKVVTERSREVMAAADVLLVASGTVTLEAALVKRPMVVAYKLAGLTYFIARRLVKVGNVALPNLLTKEKSVPEFLQAEAIPDNLAPALLPYFQAEQARQQTDVFMTIHQELRQNASVKAADAVLELIERGVGE